MCFPPALPYTRPSFPLQPSRPALTSDSSRLCSQVYQMTGYLAAPNEQTSMQQSEALEKLLRSVSEK